MNYYNKFSQQTWLMHCWIDNENEEYKVFQTSSPGYERYHAIVEEFDSTEDTEGPERYHHFCCTTTQMTCMIEWKNKQTEKYQKIVIAIVNDLYDTLKCFRQLLKDIGKITNQFEIIWDSKYWTQALLSFAISAFPANIAIDFLKSIKWRICVY